MHYTGSVVLPLSLKAGSQYDASFASHRVASHHIALHLLSYSTCSQYYRCDKTQYVTLHNQSTTSPMYYSHRFYRLLYKI